MRGSFRVVDVDCHQIEPRDLWSRYLDAEYRDRAPVAGEVNGHPVTVVEGETAIQKAAAPQPEERKFGEGLFDE